mmetsp:Transcript_42738/g.72926  ORF Transcript_42738/g.72926 Transcript_42738/m.72926 type:complete len:491 (-) Transcript_42738:881-2353(-)
MMGSKSNACSQELLSILAHALPTIVSYTLPSERVVQANAEGTRVLARYSSTLSEKFDTCASAADEPGKGGDVEHDSRLLVTAQDGQHSHNESGIEETELFIKRVMASSYTHKTWTDMRRTLVYLRTEVRFYNEIVPLLLAGDSSGVLQKYLPKVHHADYNLNGLVPEDSPSTDAKQLSPFPSNDEQAKGELLKEKGGYILLQSLSPSHGYFQDSPIPLEQSLSCLTAVAELHASAWGNVPLLQTIHDRLSSAGGSYQLQFRNPKELQNMVASWEYFCGQFAGLDGDERSTKILEKESVVKLGQRVFDMAEYVSKELSPQVDDEYATLVHGDYKAMNVFLPNKADEGNDSAIMIDFSCTGIGYGMSDVGMHIVHANLPADLDNGGEERLVEGYLVALEDAMNRKLGSAESGKKWTYPRGVAMRHYQLACIDYLRFILGRFWRSATPESFEKKKASKNTTLINRNLDSALRFIEKVDVYLEVFEKEKTERGV